MLTFPRLGLWRIATVARFTMKDMVERALVGAALPIRTVEIWQEAVLDGARCSLAYYSVLPSAPD